MGPSEEAEADFAKELAKMVTDTSTESRKVDKKTASALWDSAVLPPIIRKKRTDHDDEKDGPEVNGHSVMNFTVITKRGNKQQVCSFHGIESSSLSPSRSLGSSTRYSICISASSPYPICSAARQG